MKKFVVLLFAVFFLQSCGTLRPPVKMPDLISKSSSRDVAITIEDMADKCWNSMGTIMPDQIQVRSKASLNGTYTIKASRVGQGVVMDPFIIISIRDRQEGGSLVEIKEGDFACTFTKCRSVNFTHDVQRWIDGDLSCGPKSYSERHKINSKDGQN